MIAYFREYRQLAKVGLLCVSHQMLFVTAIFMFLFGKGLGVSLEIFVFALTSIGYMSDLEANKYVINYSLPISMKRRLKMMYVMTIVGDMVSVLMVHLRYYIVGQERSLILTLSIFMINIIGCNLYYYLFCSSEFNKGIVDGGKKQLLYQCIVGATIGVSLAIRLKYGITQKIDDYMSTWGCGVSMIWLGAMFAFTLWWTMHSFKKVECTVRSCSEKI